MGSYLMQRRSALGGARAAILGLLTVCLSLAAFAPSARAASVAVGTAPAGMALNPTTGLLYVANAGDGAMSVVSTGTNTVVATVSFIPTVSLGGSPAPVGVGVDVSSNLVFVAESGAKQIAIIDGATNLIRGTVPADPGPWGVAVNQRTNTVYVTTLAGSVTVLDGTSGALRTVVRDVRLARPLGLAVNEATNQVFIASRDSNSVAVLDGETNAVVAAMPAGSMPAAVAFDPTTGAIYVANAGANTLTVFNPPQNALVATRTTGNGPVAVAVDPTNGTVYAAAADGTVTELDSVGNTVATVSDPALTGVQGIVVGPNAVYVTAGAGSAVVVLPLARPVPTGG
jgi:YVTN family beta-propeller protein